MTLVSDIKTRLEAEVTALTGRVDEVADLAVLVSTGALPQRNPAAFVVPLGFDGGTPDAAAGLYRQSTTETVGVILFVEAAGDPRARRALATVDQLKDAVVAAIAGWAPDDAIGVFVARRGRLVSVNAGTVIYQIDFSLMDQLRIAS
ncbi:MAG: hypothetical protein WD928_04985 [Gammaproteobacteria bacterium]